MKLGMIGFDGEGWLWVARRGGSVPVTPGANKQTPILLWQTIGPPWPWLRKQPSTKPKTLTAKPVTPLRYLDGVAEMGAR